MNLFTAQINVRLGEKYEDETKELIWECRQDPDTTADQYAHLYLDRIVTEEHLNAINTESESIEALLRDENSVSSFIGILIEKYPSIYQSVANDLWLKSGGVEAVYEACCTAHLAVRN